MVRRRTPRPLGEVVAAAVDRAAPATTLALVQRIWAGAVGDRVAAEAAPVSEHDGVVTVACTTATWAQELDLLGDEITTRLRQELPESAVLGGLRFVVREDSL